MTIRPPVAANGWPAASDEPLTLSFDAVDRAEGFVEAEALLAEDRVLPGLRASPAPGGEGLVDLVEVEVLEGGPLARQHPRHGIGRSHQQAFATVHVVDGGSLGCAQEGERRCPWIMAQSSDDSSTADAPSVSGVELPAVIVAVSPLPKTGLRVPSFSIRGVGPEVLVALESSERRELVVEEPRVVGRSEVLV